MHYTYIIESAKTGNWYYGYTAALEQRLLSHNEGLNASTRNRGPWKFVFIRGFPSRSEALAFEKLLKKTRNKEFIRSQFAEFFI